MRSSRSSASSARGFIGIEAGGTRTVALWVDEAEPLHARDRTHSPTPPETRTVTLGPANLQLISDADLADLFSRVAHALPCPRAVAAGMAGARTPDDLARVGNAVRSAWPGVPFHATNDLEIALAAAEADSESRHLRPRVLVLSGTGSCCYGRSGDREPVRAGGWGHLLGDRGSGYAIALAALRAVIAELDLRQRWDPCGQLILSHLHLNEPDDLISWSRDASKAAVAALAPVVFQAAAGGSRLARRILDDAATEIAGTAAACAARLARPRERVQFLLAGGVLLGQPAFARRVSRAILRLRPNSDVAPLPRPGVDGAVHLARRVAAESGPPPGTAGSIPPAGEARNSSGVRLPAPTGLSPTEQRHPLSMSLDRLKTSDAIRLMMDEDAKIPSALRPHVARIARLIQLATRALRSGGRLLYVGAGTSGRLGILDASECPPTFQTPPELVQGIIAGGAAAVFRSVEGAEDDVDAGARAIRFHAVKPPDLVVGIAASGRTPFVWGALAEAARRRARTALICFNPHLRWPADPRPDVVLAADLGPEILTGSTRLKAGTATKMILNMVTTLTMVRLGKVLGNLMIDLDPSNEKLRDRAVRITTDITGADADAARAALEAAGWRVREAVRALQRRRT